MGIHPPETPTASSSSHSNWLSPVLTLSTLGVRDQHKRKHIVYVTTTEIILLSCLQEFEISMTKVNGSLGFTLRKEDESILGHYVRSLVKEPAISDGRICPGDNIISVSYTLTICIIMSNHLSLSEWNLKKQQVNSVDISAMSHTEAVAFLRRCPDSITIRLFRDSAVTPLSPLSPTEPEPGLNRPRPLLRFVVSGYFVKARFSFF